MLPLGLAEGLVGAGFGCARCRLGVPVGMSLGGSVRRFTLVGLVTCGCVTGFPVPVRPLSCRRPSSAVHLAIGNSLLDIGYSPLPSPVACLLTTYYCSPFSRSAAHYFLQLTSLAKRGVPRTSDSRHTTLTRPPEACLRWGIH